MKGCSVGLHEIFFFTQVEQWYRDIALKIIFFKFCFRLEVLPSGDINMQGNETNSDY